MRKQIELPFYKIREYGNEVYHLHCAGEVAFRKAPMSKRKIAGRCQRCFEEWAFDKRTLLKQFPEFEKARKRETRKQLIKELKESPLYPVVEIEEFSFGDGVELRRFDNGAAMVKKETGPFGRILAISKSGHFEHLPKERGPQGLRLTKFGSVRGKETRPAQY